MRNSTAKDIMGPLEQPELNAMISCSRKIGKVF